MSQTALPYFQNRPPLAAEGGPLLSVAQLVALEFPPPERPMQSRKFRSAIRATVPETPVDEDRKSYIPKGNVRRPWQGRIIPHEPMKPLSPEFTLEKALGSRIGGSIRLHAPSHARGAGRWRRTQFRDRARVSRHGVG